jgi:predicted CxxxxCH...CXXCH cytochrome family protein
MKHVQISYTGAISTGDYGNYSSNTWYAVTNLSGTPNIGCGLCHPQSDATHNNGTVNLNFNIADTGAAGTMKAKNSATESYSQTERTSVTCSSVYCHSDGAGTYKTSPDWFGGTFTGNKCDDCHGNSPATSSHAKHVVGIHYLGIYTGTTGLATAGTGNTNSHGNASYSSTINCNTCHNSTVTASANDQNTVCLTCHNGTDATLRGNLTIAAGSTTHVNGTPDIAFSAVNVKSKAQVRDDITTVADINESWDRTVSGAAYKAAGAYDRSRNALNTVTMYNSTTKTCSTIACHNGNSIKWGATGVSCNNCHTGMPK